MGVLEQDKLWEAVEEEWIDCLGYEPVENLLKISSGVVQVEALSAVVSSFSRSIGSPIIVDGGGQVYLVQVLSFQLGLSVVAMDGSFHHGNVTGLRASQIKKLYVAKILKSSIRSEDRICNLDHNSSAVK